MRFPAYRVDPATGVAEFDYVLDGPAPLEFTETITFPPSTGKPPAHFFKVLELLHVIAGVSYYKVGAPARIEAPTAVPAEAAALFTAVYTHGLGEYAYVNQLPHVLELSVQVPAESPAAQPVDNAAGRPLSAVGGGKDSIVTLE